MPKGYPASAKIKSKEDLVIDGRPTLQDIKNFITTVQKKFGKEVLNYQIEVHYPKMMHDKEFMISVGLGSMGIASYEEDKRNGYPKKSVVVFKV
jgi:hypothetical protein